MRLKKLLFLVLLLASSFIFGLIFTNILKLNMFDKNSLGFQYLFFTFLFSFVYFALRYLRSLDAYLIAIFLGLIYAYLINKTSLAYKFEAFWQIIIYAVMLFVSLTAIFNFTWFYIKAIRNITFSILSSFSYALVHVLVSIFLKIPITGRLLLAYFKNGFMLLLVISFAISIAEIVYSGILNFFTPPKLPVHLDEE